MSHFNFISGTGLLTASLGSRNSVSNLRSVGSSFDPAALQLTVATPDGRIYPGVLTVCWGPHSEYLVPWNPDPLVG